MSNVTIWRERNGRLRFRGHGEPIEEARTSRTLREWLDSSDTETIRAMLKRNDPNGEYDVWQLPSAKAELSRIALELDADGDDSLWQWIRDGQPSHGERATEPF